MAKDVLNKYRSLLLNRGLTSRHEGALFVERVKSSSNVATSLALPLFPRSQPHGLKWKANYSSQNSLIGYTKLLFPAPLARRGDWARPSVDRLGDYNSRDAS